MPEKTLGHLFEIGLDFAAKGSRDATRTLHSQLKAAILDGKLKAGMKLPPTRLSESVFGVSRNTAVEVYELLLSEGLIVSRQGSGTYVAETKVDFPRLPAKPAEPDPRVNPIWISADVSQGLGFWQGEESLPGDVEFRPALIDSRLFPWEGFRKVSAKQLRGLEKRPPAYKSPQGNQGNYRLREAITRHIALTRALVCRPEDLLVTAGAQQGFDLLARVLVTPGRTKVAIEDPGYPPMRAAFVAAGAVLVPVSVDNEGMRVEALSPDIGVVCVCPSHQFPLGVTMTKRRRADLVAFARRQGAVIVEDDYDGEFRYDGTPLESLRAADCADVVVHVGTFSKCMLPALRLGFLVAPPWAMPALVTAKNCLDWHCPTPLQLGVAGFIAEGHLTRHVRKMRQIYKKRRILLEKALAANLGRHLEPIPSFYGMHVAALAKDALDCGRIAAELGRSGVRVHSLARYHLGSMERDGLVFGFGATDLADIGRGIGQLCRVVG